MIKGYLRILVLKALHERSQSGYSLMQHIAQASGRKPSPGTMYPLLKDLKEKGFISFKEEGRSKIYSLTKKGQRSMSKLVQQKESMMLRKIELFKTLEDFMDKEELKPIIDWHTSIHCEGEPLLKSMEAWSKLRATVLETLRKPADKKIAKMTQLLKDVEKKIKKLK